MLQNLIYVGIGLLGVLIHTLIKANSLKTRAEKANIKFLIRNYFDKDWISILISVCIVFFWLLIYQEVMNKYLLKYTDLIGTIFGLIGFLGTYILSKILSVSEKRINNIIDEKTNELDEIKSKG
jgi:mannose/fructose/N-acetylgalactosamine-specific phosphotransferase system component IIC